MKLFCYLKISSRRLSHLILRTIESFALILTISKNEAILDKI